MTSKSLEWGCLRVSSSEPVNRRTLVAIIVVVLVVSVTAVWVGREFIRSAALALFAHAPREKKFMTAWEHDLQRLKVAKSLHPGFESIKKIQLYSPSDRMKKIFKKYPINFELKPQGRYMLEVFMDEIEGGEGVVIQYDLVDTKTGNTVWELGRTFPHKLDK
jgi:hypothetical protein